MDADGISRGARPFEERAAEYDRWFDENGPVYRAELAAVRALWPAGGRSLEIGAGTGRFGAPLGTDCGVEPAPSMARTARDRGMRVVRALAEELPFEDAAFDTVLMVTVICFLEDVQSAFREARRVLKEGGLIVAGILDRETELGRKHEATKHGSEFYRNARFHSSEEVIAGLERAGFTGPESVQTVFADGGDGRENEPVEPGRGRGLFAVIRMKKPALR